MKNLYKNKYLAGLVFAAVFALLAVSCGRPNQKATEQGSPTSLETLKSRLVLETTVDPKTQLKTSKGTFAVLENRDSGEGRMIHLDVLILHGEGTEVKPDPFFVLAGGPGANAAIYKSMFKRSWIRKERDIVLVSQRGTGGDNKLDCSLPADDSNLQGYLDPLFNLEAFQACMKELQKKYDLTKYSTCLAADDLNDVRRALGYDTINIMGGSYGTRMALVYMRRHPQTVRTAILNGVVPIAFKNPLFHAPNAEESMRLLMARCANNPDCHAAYPNLEDEFHIILERLEKQPAEVTITHPVTKERVSVKLTRAAFAEAVRTIMYNGMTLRLVPFLIHRAFEGDYEPFAQRGMESNRGIRRMLAMGMLLCVTCAEDVARISEDEIVKYTTDTFLGDGRVRQQKAVCEFWPKSDLPDNYGDPVSVDVPTLLLSGTLDPVTPPRWGREAAGHLPNSLHLVIPGAHGVGGKCVTDIEKQFLEKGTVKDLDVSCTKDLKPIRFKIAK